MTNNAQRESTYDRWSPYYDALAGASERPLRREGLRLLVPRDGERVLEIGAGTGDSLETLGKGGARVVGLDLSRGMLGKARARRTSAALIQADALTLPLRDSSFDAVFMSFVLELFEPEEQTRLLAELCRVLRAEGRLALVCMADRPGPLSRLYRWSHERWPSWVDCRPIDAAGLLREEGWMVETTLPRSVWGLPVDVLLARRDAGTYSIHPSEAHH